jgi:hypothetical protein
VNGAWDKWELVGARGVTRPRRGFPPWHKVPKDCPPPPPSGHGCENAEDCKKCCLGGPGTDAYEWSYSQCMADCLKQPGPGIAPYLCWVQCIWSVDPINCVTDCLRQTAYRLCEQRCRSPAFRSRWIAECWCECSGIEFAEDPDYCLQLYRTQAHP